MTATRIGINGFGRMGRLALRAAWDWPELEFTHINELKGDAGTAAHLLTFDSIHGRWDRDIRTSDRALTIEGAPISFGSVARAVKWPGAGQRAHVLAAHAGVVADF